MTRIPRPSRAPTRARPPAPARARARDRGAATVASLLVAGAVAASSLLVGGALVVAAQVVRVAHTADSAALAAAAALGALDPDPCAAADRIAAAGSARVESCVVSHPTAGPTVEVVLVSQMRLWRIVRPMRPVARAGLRPGPDHVPGTSAIPGETRCLTDCPGGTVQP